MNNLKRTVTFYASCVLLLAALVSGMDAFLLLYFVRAASVLVLTVLSVNTWRTIWSRYLRN